MLFDRAFGIVPFLAGSFPRQYLLILHRKGHWGFPKGHQDLGESDLQTARREFEEETGIQDYLVRLDPSFCEAYTFINHEGKPVEKTVLYFLAEVAPEAASVRIQAEELADFRWCTYAEAQALLSFEASRQLLRQCERHLNQGS